ncbi:MULTISPECIES: MATE family efflux transporter [Fusobacterium]|uniref:MATE family efflux transporter n=1 Tax=Fusobacterium TaxID=848 RepID=UPI00102F754F|nr:MATE family efflux transporter [Fusobacterium ulcerans]
MEQKNLLTEGSIFKSLMKFSFPFLLASLLQAFYGAADLFVVGQYADSAAVSAVAIGSQVMQTITGVILGITTGGTILIGQYLGAKREKDMAKTIGTIICVFGFLSVVLTILMVLFTNPIARIMHTPDEAMKYTQQYIFICSCGIPFIIGYNAVSGILRGMGDSKTPLYFIAIACVINITVDIILVDFFKMGAVGAAAATVGAQGISFLLAVLFLWKKGFPFEFGKKYILLFPKKAKIIFHLGLPIALQDGLINISFLLITTIINTMGLTASAAVGVVEKIIVFAMLPPTAFASAIAVMTAQNIGAGKVERAQKSLYAGIACSLVMGIAFWIYSQISPESITSLFSNDKEVIYTAAAYLKSYSLDCILVCFIFCMNSFFSGCGHPIFPMVHSLIATFLIRIPVSFFLSRIEGITLYKIGFGAPLATFISLIMCIIYMKYGSWKNNAMLKNR